MSVFVSNVASGTWSNPATWLQDGVAATRAPGSGDTATIVSGHDITLDAATTIGAGTGVALTIGNGVDSGAGNSTPIATGRTRLTVAAPLVVKGHLFCGGVRGRYHYVELSAGQGIELDGNAGFQPLIYTDGTNNGSLRIIANGTSGSHCYIRSSATKAAEAGGLYKGRFTNITAGYGEQVGYESWSLTVSGQYIDFTDLGVDKAVDPGGNGAFGVVMRNFWQQDPSLPYLRLAHANFLRTPAQIWWYSSWAAPGSDGYGYGCSDWTFKDTPYVVIGGPYNVGTCWYGTPSPGGGDGIDWARMGFDRPTYAAHVRSLGSGIAFGAGYYSSAAGVTSTGPWSDVLAVVPDPATTPGWSGDQSLGFLRTSGKAYSRTYLCNLSSLGNQHVGQVEFSGVADTLTFTDFILDGPLVSALVDDYFDCTSLPSGATVNVSGFITLPGIGGTHDIPTLCWFMGAAGGHASIEHCTIFTRSGSGEGAIHCDYYTTPGQPGMLSAVKSNLFVNAPGTATGNVFETQSGTGSGFVTDAAYATDITNNNLCNSAYNGVFSSGTPGANDKAVDPQFVDSTRNVTTWWRTQVGAADPAYVAGQTPDIDVPRAIAWLVAHPASVPAMIDWVRAGFVPRNAAIATAAHDGGTIGAMAMTGTPPTGAGRCPTVQADADSGMLCPDLKGTDLLPLANPWYAEFRRDISADPVDSNSARWCQMIADIYSGGSLRPASRYVAASAFGTDPYMIVDKETTPYTFCPGHLGVGGDVPAQNWMLPPPPISQEGNAYDRYAVRGVDTWFNPSNSDYHFKVIVREAGNPIEYWEYLNPSVEYDTNGNINKLVATSYRYYDLTSTTPPADGTTSVSAGGLPTLPLGYTMAELLSGTIDHALRVSVHTGMCCSRNAWPSLSDAEGYNPDGFPLGARFRIKADRVAALLATVGATSQAAAVVRAGAKYGFIVDDFVGDPYFWIQGSIDNRYDDAAMQLLLNIHPATDMEVVATRYSALISGPTTLNVGQTGTFTVTDNFPAGVAHGASVRFYRTDDPSTLNPADRGLIGGINASGMTASATLSFSQPGQYYAASNFQFCRWYVQPFIVTVAPDAPATTYTLALSGGGTVGAAITATVTPDSGYTGIVTLTPSGCGLTTPVTLTFSGQASLTATFTPTAAGTLVVAGTNGGGLANPPAQSAAVASSPATSYRLDLSGGTEIGERVVAIITPNGTATGNATLTPSGCGLATPVTVAFSGASPVLAYFLPTSGPGTITVTPTNTAGLPDPAAAARAISLATDGGITIHATMAGVFPHVV